MVVSIPTPLATVIKRLGLLSQGDSSLLLRDHALKGSRNHQRSIDVTGDIRIVYETRDDGVYLVDLDNHNNLYR